MSGRHPGHGRALCDEYQPVPPPSEPKEPANASLLLLSRHPAESDARSYCRSLTEPTWRFVHFFA
jgi:hypothetical protein